MFPRFEEHKDVATAFDFVKRVKADVELHGHQLRVVVVDRAGELRSDRFASDCAGIGVRAALECTADSTWAGRNVYAILLTLNGGAIAHTCNMMHLLVDSSMESEATPPKARTSLAFEKLTCSKLFEACNLTIKGEHANKGTRVFKADGTNTTVLIGKCNDAEINKDVEFYSYSFAEEARKNTEADGTVTLANMVGPTEDDLCCWIPLQLVLKNGGNALWQEWLEKHYNTLRVGPPAKMEHADFKAKHPLYCSAGTPCSWCTSPLINARRPAPAPDA